VSDILPGAGEVLVLVSWFNWFGERELGRMYF
jgi:hypothetical protein